MPVEQLRTGMSIYTEDAAGEKITGIISKTASVPAPIGLSDGRSVSASPGHPTPDGRAIGDLKVGDMLDSAIVVSVTSVPYSGFTLDILPDGGTGLYWANGILLKSTLTQ